MNYIIEYFQAGWWVFVAYAGLLLAGGTWLAIRLRRIPGWLGEVIIMVCIGASLYSFGWTEGRNNYKETREIERLREVVAIQAKQREEAELIARRELQRALERAAENEILQQKVEEYETLIANGTASSCPADDAYTRSMLNIKVNGKPPASTPAAISRPSDPMPKSTPDGG